MSAVIRISCAMVSDYPTKMWAEWEGEEPDYDLVRVGHIAFHDRAETNTNACFANDRNLTIETTGGQLDRTTIS
jgi:hypothetical protein